LRRKISINHKVPKFLEAGLKLFLSWIISPAPDANGGPVPASADV
jgi:hypothetical protein